MKIQSNFEDKRKRFDEVPRGGIFVNCQTTYIKVLSDYYNAVELDSGSAVTLSDDIIVYIPTSAVCEIEW